MTVIRHALRNALIPILTGVVVVIPTLFMGSLLVESFFGAFAGIHGAADRRCRRRFHFTGIRHGFGPFSVSPKKKCPEQCVPVTALARILGRMKEFVMSLFAFALLWGCGLSASTAQVPGWRWLNPLPQGNALHDVSALGHDRAAVAGDHGTIMTTTDGGSHWRVSAEAGGSGASPRNSSTTAGSFKVAGCRTGNPLCRARAFTAGMVSNALVEMHQAYSFPAQIARQRVQIFKPKVDVRSGTTSNAHFVPRTAAIAWGVRI